ncbi:hypothetical protein SDC9_125952 [bioreactor metagenome]|uniref:HTH cro/C1-type domain-containing protein n=1 Tax=bioreactor metagenome TaxID=1076179 RepID=A0A645CPV0_9ZZZZ
MQTNGISSYRLAKATDSSPTTVTNWLNGAMPGADKLKEIADFLSVSTDYLLGKTNEKSPAQKEQGELTFNDFTYAMHNESKELSEESKAKLLEMAKFFKQQQDKENNK